MVLRDAVLVSASSLRKNIKSKVRRHEFLSKPLNKSVFLSRPHFPLLKEGGITSGVPKISLGSNVGILTSKPTHLITELTVCLDWTTGSSQFLKFSQR